MIIRLLSGFGAAYFLFACYGAAINRKNLIGFLISIVMFVGLVFVAARGKK